MAKDIYITPSDTKQGLYALEDTSKAPFGTASEMKNMRITDRGGIAPRLGTTVVGDLETDTINPIRSAYVSRRSFGFDEFLVKPFDTFIKIYSLKNPTLGWFTIKTGLTADKQFGFSSHLVNEENKDYVIMSNRYDNYLRWTGEYSTLTNPVTAGATTITMGDVLDEDILFSGTATGNTTTTITDSTAKWATSQWKELWVVFTNSNNQNLIRKVTANTATQLTFAAVPAAFTVNPTFEIRRLRFSETGSVIYGGTEIEYTAMPTRFTLTVASAHAAPAGTVIAQAVEEVAKAPRGNRIANYLTRIVIGNVRSALALDDAGATQGATSAGSYYVSKIKKNDDFSFQAARLADDGGVVSTPYGGGNINDVIEQEDAIYVFKDRYIEAFKLSTDQSNIARETLKTELGSVSRVIKGSDDVYFMTPDRRLTSLGRVINKDIKPHTTNLGSPIKRILDEVNPDDFNGAEDEDRIYFSVKSNSEKPVNDITISYNKQNKVFEGIWDIPASSILKTQDNRLLYASTNDPNIYQMNTGHADIVNDDRFPIINRFKSHFFNLTPTSSNLQSMQSVYFEGLIASGTKINFDLFKDFETNAFFEFSLESAEDGELIFDIPDSASLGKDPMGTSPMGAGTSDPDGRQRFQFRIYFPFQHANYFAYGFGSDQPDDDYEILTRGFGLLEDVSLSTRVKN